MWGGVMTPPGVIIYNENNCDLELWINEHKPHGLSRKGGMYFGHNFHTYSVGIATHHPNHYCLSISIEVITITLNCYLFTFMLAYLLEFEVTKSNDSISLVYHNIYRT